MNFYFIFKSISSVGSNNHGVVIFIWFKGHLFFWGKSLFLKSLNFTLENYCWLLGWINTVGLDGDHEMSTVLKEVLCIYTDDSGLIWLGDIRKNDINHTDQKSVFKWSSGITNNGDNIGSFFGHINKISTWSVGEFYCIDCSLWSNNIWDVWDCSTTCSTKIKNLGTWLDIDITDTTNDGGGDLTSVWVPDSVFNFFTIGNILTHSLFIVNTFSWSTIFSEKGILWSLGNKYTLKSVWDN